jgi:hypothetical protein
MGGVLAGGNPDTVSIGDLDRVPRLRGGGVSTGDRQIVEADAASIP